MMRVSAISPVIILCSRLTGSMAANRFHWWWCALIICIIVLCLDIRIGERIHMSHCYATRLECKCTVGRHTSSVYAGRICYQFAVFTQWNTRPGSCAPAHWSDVRTSSRYRIKVCTRAIFASFDDNAKDDDDIPTQWKVCMCVCALVFKYTDKALYKSRHRINVIRRIYAAVRASPACNGNASCHGGWLTKGADAS